MVLSRGLIGDVDGRPKLACPMHKKTFSLETGEGLSDPDLSIQTFPVKVEDGGVFVQFPSVDSLQSLGLCSGRGNSCREPLGSR